MTGMQVKFALYAGVAIGTMATVMPAAAQDAQDVIVTARRVEERLQDVPISITVFNQEQLSDRNVTNGAELADYTPSLTANSRYGPENTTFAIRGFSQDGRTTASVGTYFADVVAPRGGSNSIATGDGAGPGAFFDLQNVQVLKGPQGTLFGRNTTGGAVLLVPQKPTGDLEGYVEGSYGNYDMKRLQGVLNVPLGEDVRFRVGADHMERDGYLKNISGVGPDRLGSTNYTAVRASLVVDLTPNLENYTILSYSRSNGTPGIPKVTACNPTSLFGALTCQTIARQANEGFYTVQASVPDPQSLLRQWQVINTTTWHASDTMTIKNIMSYSQITNKIRADYFGGTWILPSSISFTNAAGVTTTRNFGAAAGSVIQFNNIYSAPNMPIADQSNFTEEVQVQGSAFGDKLTYQLGAYMELSNPLGDLAAYSVSRMLCADRFNQLCSDPVGPGGNLTVQRFRASYKDYGLYGQASYSLTDQLKLTAGLRYTWDVTRSRASNVSMAFFPVTTGLGRCANTTIPGVTALRFPTLAAALDRCLDLQEQKSDAPTWIVGLDFKPIDDLLLYIKYSRGYRQGSTNPLGAGGFTTFDPEKVDTYEGGVKASWRGAVPGFFNISGFYNDFSNQQLVQTFIDTTNTAAPNAGIVNVGKSRIYGFEIESGITPFDGFRIDGSYAYLNSKLTETAAPTFPPGSPYNSFVPLAVGQALPLTPKNKYTITGTYTLPLPESVGEVSIGATYAFVDDQIVTVSRFGALDSYKLLNLNLNWRGVAGSPVDLSLFATNVTKEKYYIQNNDNFSSLGVASSVVGQPRMYGLRLRYSFGQ